MDEILNYSRLPDEDFYALLGCNQHSTAEQISTEYKIRALACHPDKHLNDPEADKSFALLERAKSTLLDPELRRQYDYWYNSGLSVPYNTWLSMRKSVQTSMHWAVRKSQPMLPETSPDSETRQRDSDTKFYLHTKSTSDDLRQKFRNYEI